MAGSNPNEQVTTMIVLGGGFQVGDLYDYRNDRKVTGLPCWNADEMARATLIDDKFQLELNCPDFGSSSHKWENMGLDEHLQASVMAGLIGKYRGAAKYLSDQEGFSKASQVLIIHAEMKKVSLDLQTLLSKELSPSVGLEAKVDSPSATHVVVGVTYGAEVYCVLGLELNGQSDDVAQEDARELAQEFLHKIARKMKEALDECLDFSVFKNQLKQEEASELTRIRCRLYADLQTSAFEEFSIIDAYKHCRKLIDQVKKTDIRNKKLIPIHVLLCPLEIITDQAGRCEYHDVDPELVDRCRRIWDALDSVCAQALTMHSTNGKSNRDSLRLFDKFIGKYKQLFAKELTSGISVARQNGNEDVIEKAVKIAENHSIFKPSRLRRWLDYKQAEYEMSCKINGITRIQCLSNKRELERNLQASFDKKFTVVLTIPSLDGRTKAILDEMKEYIDSYKKLVAVSDDGENSGKEDSDDEEDDDNIPWHMFDRNRRPVLAKISELAEHVEMNKHVEKDVQFFILLGEADEKFGYCYSVYEMDRLLKGSMSQLPGAPTDLQLHFPDGSHASRTTSSPTIYLEWNYAECYFCFWPRFVVEYTTSDGNGETWVQKKTSKAGEMQIAIPYVAGSVMKFRVAADTCIGRSTFSEETSTNADDQCVPSPETESTCLGIEDLTMNDETRMDDGDSTSLASTVQLWTETDVPVLQPPTDVKVEMATQSTAELTWRASSTGNETVFYFVEYWPEEDDISSADQLRVLSNEYTCRLNNLQPETTYNVHIVAVADSGQTSAPSEQVQVTTLNQQVRFAECIIKNCIKLVSRNGMDHYAVPLTKSPTSNPSVKHFIFGQRNLRNKAENKTILVMGATGAGKTTLINAMINYIFGVEWEDSFRFQLIDQQVAGRSQIDSQTSRITVYDILHAEGFRIPYSLTIVDTPGYGDTKGLDRDQEITEMIRNFFKDKNGIQQLDVIGFVAQASLPRLTPTQMYIFDSVLSIFGNDVKENIDFLLTFADSQTPPVLSAITDADLPCPKDPVTGHPLHHTFNNSGFFCSNREIDGAANTSVGKFNKFFWRTGMENFKRFFATLATMKMKSLTLTQQVLDERKQLEVTVDGLQPLIKIGLAKMEEMRKIKQMITNSQAQIEANENVTIDVWVNVPHKRQNTNTGRFLTNCNKCYVTCHPICIYANDEEKVKCAAMDQGMPAEIRTCTVCPNKCIWNMHANQPYRWEYILEKKTTSSDAIKQKYEKALKKKLTANELESALQQDLEVNNRAVLNHVDTVARCIQKLDEIALRPNPFSAPQYIDLIIDAEEQEKRQGYQERIVSLRKLSEMAAITNKVKNKENLLSSHSAGPTQ